MSHSDDDTHMLARARTNEEFSDHSSSGDEDNGAGGNL
jgi:hypothetical protein